MATQIFGKDHAVMLPRPVDASQCAVDDANGETLAQRGSAARGFFYAMLFNVLLLLLGVAAWGIWRTFVG